MVYRSRMKGFALLALVFALGCTTTRNDSVSAQNAGAKAFGAHRWDEAIENFKKATDRWKENHAAWYGLAASYAQKKDWEKASESAERAVSLEEDYAMYHMMYGWYLYEKAIQQAKQAQAAKENKKVEEVEADLTGVNFEKARTHLEKALQLNDELWRAHYLIGSIHRHAGKAKEAAEAFSKSLQLGAYDPSPWIALAELYRRWDYSDQAIQVSEQGVLAVPGDPEKSDIWFEVGMGYADKRLYEKAIAAFDKALEARRDNHLAKFARGQAYFFKGDHAKAKQDLEEFSKSGSTSLEFFKQQSSRMLMEIATKSAAAEGAASAPKPSPEDLVKKKSK